MYRGHRILGGIASLPNEQKDDDYEWHNSDTHMSFSIAMTTSCLDTAKKRAVA